MTIHQNEVSLGAGEGAKAQRWSKPTIDDMSVTESTEIGAFPGTDGLTPGATSSLS